LLALLKTVLAEPALNTEIYHHLGCEELAGNNRNGYARKKVPPTRE